jgi:CMD domain protein
LKLSTEKDAWMTQGQAAPINNAPPDLLDQLAGLVPGSAAATVRRQRPEVARFTQGSYEALLADAEPDGVSQTERLLIGLRVAILSGSTTLATHYRQGLAQSGVDAQTIAAVEQFPASEDLTSRTAALLRYVDRVINEPRTATPAHLAELQAQGLSVREIVTVAQLIAFLSYQVRLLAGLRLLAEEA